MPDLTDTSQPLSNPRHERFCQEYVIDFNGARSYRAAGFKVSKDSGADRANAWRMITNDSVQQRIRYLAQEQQKRVFESNQATIKRRIIDALNSRITDYMRWDADGNATLLPAHMIENAELIKELSVENGKVRIKMMDKDRALEHLLRIEKLLVDSREQSGELMVRQSIEANSAYRRRLEVVARHKRGKGRYAHAG